MTILPSDPKTFAIVIGTGLDAFTCSQVTRDGVNAFCNHVAYVFWSLGLIAAAANKAETELHF
jgi:hypothetical protein